MQRDKVLTSLLAAYAISTGLTATVEAADSILTLNCYHRGWSKDIYFTFDFSQNTVQMIDENKVSMWSIIQVDQMFIKARREFFLEEPEEWRGYVIDRAIEIFVVNRSTGEMTGEHHTDGPELRSMNKWVTPNDDRSYYDMPCIKTDLKPQF